MMAASPAESVWMYSVFHLFFSIALASGTENGTFIVLH